MTVENTVELRCAGTHNLSDNRADHHAVHNNTDNIEAPPYAYAMSNILLVVFIGFVSASVSASSPAVLSRYRDVSLGDSVQTVVERLQAVASDVKVVHDRPALVQELTWRTRPFVSGTAAVSDPLAEMVLTFHLGRLARIVATYDRERTVGLTDADLAELLGELYGLPLLRATEAEPTPAASAASLRKMISVWADAEATVTLWREDYPRRIGLTITSVTADRALQTAIADGVRLTGEEAPQREREKRAAAAAALKERDAQIRRDNKAKFKP